MLSTLTMGSIACAFGIIVGVLITFAIVHGIRVVDAVTLVGILSVTHARKRLRSHRGIGRRIGNGGRIRGETGRRVYGPPGRRVYDPACGRIDCLTRRRVCRRYNDRGWSYGARLGHGNSATNKGDGYGDEQCDTDDLLVHAFTLCLACFRNSAQLVGSRWGDSKDSFKNSGTIDADGTLGHAVTGEFAVPGPSL